MSLTWSGAAAGASVAGRTVFTGPTDFTSALGSPAAASPEGAFTTETPRLVPPAGALITGAAEGTSVRGGSFTPVGVTGAVADVGRPAFTASLYIDTCSLLTSGALVRLGSSRLGSPTCTASTTEGPWRMMSKVLSVKRSGWRLRSSASLSATAD